MKHTKRMLAILLSLAMILTMTIAMSAVSFAAATDPYDNPLTVSGLDEGDTVNFYQVVKWDPSAEDNVGGWIAVDPFSTYLTKAVLQGILGDASATPPVAPTGITSTIAGNLAKSVSGDPLATVTASAAGEAVFDPSAPITEEGEDGEEVTTTPGPGIYMAIVTPIDADTVYNPVFVSADYNKEEGKEGDYAIQLDEPTYSDEAAAKKSSIPLTKTASVDEDNWADKNWTTTAIGETVSFTVTTKIPGYGQVYENPVFIIRDKLEDLELVPNTVTIVAPEEAEATIEESDDGYTITFDSTYLKGLIGATDVEVTYDAIVTTDAAVHVNTEKNEVSTEFSHNPSDESDHGFKKDTTQHYTFTIDAEGLGGGGDKSGKRTSELVKVGVDANGNPITETVKTSEITEENTWQGPLEGAVFGLFTDSQAKVPYEALNADGTPSGTPMTATTDEDGRMNFAGLDAGTYYLKEISAPAGYIADTGIHEIVIAAETDEVEITEYTTDGVNWISQDDYDELTDQQKKDYKSYTYKTEVLISYTITIDGEHVAASYTFTNDGTDPVIEWSEEGPVELPFQITNTQGTELPSTGGIGTVIFYTLGTILVLGCGIVLISRRRLSRKR